METTVSQMTVGELRKLIAEVIDEKLIQFVDDESDLELRDSLRKRLLAQRRRVEQGERGVPMKEVMAEFGL